MRTMRARLDGMQQENAELRTEVGQLRQAVRVGTGREAAPVVQRQQTVTVPGAGYDMDPVHAPEVTQAILRGEDHRPALREARRRIAAEVTERTGQPGTVGEYDLADKRRGASHEQRRGMAEAQRHIDMTDLPVEAGGTFTRDPESGQVHVSYPQQLTCSGGHLASPGDRFCADCGGPISSPALGEAWAAMPEDEKDPALLRRIDEGTL
jgi:hypothetical protein